MTDERCGKDAAAGRARGALRRHRAVAGLCAVATMVQTTACYRAVPVDGMSTVPRGPVTITVNDRGRLLVGARLGTLLDHIEGRVLRADATQVEVAVASTVDARDATTNWGGEPFTIPREGIADIKEHKLARRRTWLFVGAVVAGVAILAGIVRGLTTSQDPDPGTMPPVI